MSHRMKQARLYKKMFKRNHIFLLLKMRINTINFFRGTLINTEGKRFSCSCHYVLPCLVLRIPSVKYILMKLFGQPGTRKARPCLTGHPVVYLFELAEEPGWGDPGPESLLYILYTK